MKARKKSNLDFREIDFEKDLTEVVALIQRSLDPNFSLELFKWKHLENPFGKSYGLLALDGGKIIGLRMFMLWKFLNPGDGRLINALRPVDTVVDANYRGQGLFKKLTLKGLEDYRGNYSFIFNTPNENSLPGYLKMGWQKRKQVKHFDIALVNPFSVTLNFKDVAVGSILYKRRLLLPDLVSTYTTYEYFKWRYKDPKYNIAFFSKEEVYIAYSLNKKLYLIVHEVFGNTNNLSGEMLNSLAKNRRRPLIYFYNNNNLKNTSFLASITRNNPIVVLKHHENLDAVKEIDLSLADLEAVF